MSRKAPEYVPVLFASLAAATLLLNAGCHQSTTTAVNTIMPRRAGPTPGTSARTPGGTVSTPGPGATAVEPGTGVAAPLEPDPAMTPGAALSVTTADVCVSGYSQKVRNVPESVKRQVYAEYHIPTHQPGEYEVDHLISLELGGSNSIKNLWPQSYKTQPWNAHVKDQLENELHAEICAGKVDMKTAQQEIATDWIGAYKRIFHTDVPLTHVGGSSGGHHASRAVDSSVPAGGATLQTAARVSAPNAGGQVWVNLNSGKYFFPGTRYYGKTKRGQYMSEADAQRQGYVAAGGQSQPPAQ